MDAGEGFAPPMIRAYETGLLASLPAITVVRPTGIEPVSSDFQSATMTTFAKDALFRIACNKIYTHCFRIEVLHYYLLRYFNIIFFAAEYIKVCSAI